MTQKKYTAIIDVDTLIIHAALAGQEASVLVKHKATGWTKTFKNKTLFQGHHTKREGGWLGELNAEKALKGLPLVSPDDFEITPIVTKIEDQYTQNGSIITAEAVVKGRFKNKIEAITKQDWCGDYRICFATGRSFRYDIAQTQPYKSKRPEKPLLYEVVKNYMLSNYTDKIITYHDVESDEIVTQEVWEDWCKASRDFDKLTVVGCYIDKDVSQYAQLWYNFDKPELGLTKITPLEAAKNLATQMLKGDSIDTIGGLPELPEEMFAKYSLRKPGKQGLGEKTARALLDHADDLKGVFSLVLEAYRGYYGDTPQPFISFDGKESRRNWLDHMNEQYRLLRMRSDVTKDVGHVSKFLKAIGVSYE